MQTNEVLQKNVKPLGKKNKGEVEFYNPKIPLDIISSYQDDPFLGHLSTPITASPIAKRFLSLLPAYNPEISPLLRGMNIGVAHSYFLFGPFAKLGPLRSSAVSNFIGFISTISVIILLTTGLLLYGYVTFKSTTLKQLNSEKLDILSPIGWQQMSSGFILGGFGGAGIAYLLSNLIVLNLV
jgi:photosystem I subunit 11